MTADTERFRLQAALMREAEEMRIEAARLLDVPGSELLMQAIARLEKCIDAMDGLEECIDAMDGSA